MVLQLSAPLYAVAGDEEVLRGVVQASVTCGCCCCCASIAANIVCCCVQLAMHATEVLLATGLTTAVAQQQLQVAASNNPN
jgi:hypothetical protein